MTDTDLRILVVDDEKAIRRFLVTTLNAQGYVTYDAATGKEALRSVSGDRPDLVILDLGLPDMDGVEVIQRIREWSAVPVLVLSVRDRESDKIAALDAGADDYLTKPFGVGELMARIRATVRRLAGAALEPVFETGALRVDLSRRRVTLGDQDVSLTPTEYEIIRLLVQNPGKVLTHGFLLRSVWGPAYEQETHVLRVNISNLRRKIEPDPSRPRYITTEPGVGYRLAAEP